MMLQITFPIKILSVLVKRKSSSSAYASCYKTGNVFLISRALVKRHLDSICVWKNENDNIFPKTVLLAWSTSTSAQFSSEISAVSKEVANLSLRFFSLTLSDPLLSAFFLHVPQSCTEPQILLLLAYKKTRPANQPKKTNRGRNSHSTSS